MVMFEPIYPIPMYPMQYQNYMFRSIPGYQPLWSLYFFLSILNCKIINIIKILSKLIINMFISKQNLISTKIDIYTYIA